MGERLKLASVLLVLAIVLSLISIGMSLNFKNFAPVATRGVANGAPVGNVGLVVESNIVSPNDSGLNDSGKNLGGGR